MCKSSGNNRGAQWTKKMKEWQCCEKTQTEQKNGEH